MDVVRANLPRMVVFARVAELGSFAAAARDLDVGRPAVSAAVAELERSLGVTLLHRTTRSVRTTEIGEAFLGQCAAITKLAGEALAGAASASERPVGTLRVAAPSGVIGERLVAPAMARLARDHGVRVDLRCSDRRVRLVEEGLDAAIRLGIPTEAGLTMRRLARSDEIVVAPPALAARMHEPNDLIEAPWVAHAALSRRITLQGPGRARLSIDLRAAAVVDDGAAMLGLLRGGAGVGVVPRVMVGPDLRAGDLVQLFPRWRARTADLFILMPSKRPPRRVRLLIEALREEVANTRP